MRAHRLQIQLALLKHNLSFRCSSVLLFLSSNIIILLNKRTHDILLFYFVYKLYINLNLTELKRY